MNTIELQRTLPAVFAGRDSIISDVWHQLLTLQRGEAYLVEAASGTGKSSLCSYIYGYRNDYQGIICFGEKNIRSLSVHDWVEIRKRSISMLFQELRLFTELTAWENVQLKNSLTGFKSKKEIKAWFEQFGIADKWDTPVAKMSFGQQQRIAFIRALCQPFDFILLDEPTNNLDIYHATNLMKIIRKLSDELGKTVVTVLHEINYAAFYSDYICAFKDGRVAKFGTVDEVMTKEVLSEIYNVDFEIMNIQGRPLSIYY